MLVDFSRVRSHQSIGAVEFIGRAIIQVLSRVSFYSQNSRSWKNESLPFQIDQNIWYTSDIEVYFRGRAVIQFLTATTVVDLFTPGSQIAKAFTRRMLNQRPSSPQGFSQQKEDREEIFLEIVLKH